MARPRSPRTALRAETAEVFLVFQKEGVAAEFENDMPVLN